MNSHPLIINPSKMSEQEKNILNRFINKVEDKQFLFEDRVYELKEENSQNSPSVSVPFILTHSLMLRSCSINPNDSHYEIFSFKKQLGDGTFGMVFGNEGKLDKELNFKPTHYIIKLQHCKNTCEGWIQSDVFRQFESLETNHSFGRQVRDLLSELKKKDEFDNKISISLEKYMDEVDLTKMSGLAIKLPFIVKISGDTAYTFTTIERCSGKELGILLSQSTLNVDTRLKLSIELLKALKKLHEKEIIHRDIKPENIFVDLDCASGQVKRINIIDFNLSLKATEVRYGRSGTPLFMAPEAFEGAKVDTRCDIYSLGQVLALVWGTSLPELDSIEEAYFNSKHPTYPKIFSGIPELTLDDKNIIQNLIKDMMKESRWDRITLTAALQIMETLRLQIKVRGKAVETQIQIKKAEQVASDLHISLNAMAKNRISDFDMNQLLANFNSAFHAALEQLVDEPLVIEEFVTKLAIKAFMGLKTKKDILDKIDHLFASIALHRNKAISFFDDLKIQKNEFSNKKPPLNFWLSQYQTILNKFEKYSQNEVTIDNLNMLDNKIENNIEKLEQVCEKINKAIQKESAVAPTMNDFETFIKESNQKTMIQSNLGFFAAPRSHLDKETSKISHHTALSV